MLVAKYVLPAVALVGTALAQNGCTAGTNEIQNSGDAELLANCQTIAGDIVIAEQTSGDIRLPGIQRIQGSLICRDATNLMSIEAPQLSSIGGTFELSGLTVLSTLSMASLSAVNRIDWTALPALRELSFTSQVTRAAEVSITNTYLESLNGINLEQVEVFDVTNNPYLTEVDVQLGNITRALTLQANSRDLVASFPNLEWAFNMTFRNCSEVNLPSLASVNGSMGFFDNFFESFEAPNLTQTGPGGSLVFVSNQALTNISMPALRSIGGTYLIANNTRLRSIDGFTELETVGGAIDFSGNFTNVTLNSLEDVRGGFNTQTSSEFDCSPFQDAKNSGIIKGRFVCTGNQQRPGSVAQGNPTQTSSGGSSPTPSSATGQAPVNVFAVILVSVAAMGWLLSTL